MRGMEVFAVGLGVHEVSDVEASGKDKRRCHHRQQTSKGSHQHLLAATTKTRAAVFQELCRQLCQLIVWQMACTLRRRASAVRSNKISMLKKIQWLTLSILVLGL